jgi:uncharacterized protein (UPF0332 family)
MTISSEQRLELIRYRIKQAEETIDDADILIENERYRAAINRIYYGMFYSLMPLGLAHQFETSKHMQLIGWFNKNFIHKGLIDERYGKIINQAHNFRSKGDYEFYVEFDKETVEAFYNDMQDFIFRIKQYLCLS